MLFFRVFLLVSTIAFVSATIAPSPGSAETKRPRGTIAMSANKSVKARPDTAHISAGVLSIAVTARQALNDNSKRMRTMIDALKASGVKPDDIATSNFSINPRFEYDKDRKRPPRLVGYAVNNQVNVTLRDLDKVGAILDRLAELGANNVGNLSFSIANPAPLVDQARKLAVAEAIRKAKLYSQAAGVGLGHIISIRESGPRIPRPYQRRLAAPAAMRAAPPVPISAGRQSVSISVTITWALD
jgi:uncharacterized protein YggE